MKAFRGVSQILFGFLPEQTVDLDNRIWKVREWGEPIVRPVDDSTLRQAVIRGAYQWAQVNRDSGLAADLFAGRDLEAVTLNLDAGVRVDSFPKLWWCKTCRRAASRGDSTCVCGAKRWAQLHFVGYHECGRLQEPYLKRCPTHQQVRITLPGTASASEIRLDCPVCGAALQKGLGMPPCACGQGRVSYTVHRAASVYSPKGVVVINVASQSQGDKLRAAGGGQALSWVLDGLSQRNATEVGLTRTLFLQQLSDQGIASTVASQMADLAEATGQFKSQASRELDAVPIMQLREAERQAIDLALAVSLSRLRIRDLAAKFPQGSARAELYGRRYPSAVAAGALEDIELIDRLPILTGNFGFTRGDSAPGKATLIPFRTKAGKYRVYSEVGETEALFVRLTPTAVVKWLQAKGYPVEPSTSDYSARLAILKHAEIPLPGQAAQSTMGAEVLTLVHSLAHRFIRRAATFSGIDRNALSEFLMPMHLGFLVYATNRGDFIMGGLQAVFEDELDLLMNDIMNAEHRCPLDPGCGHAGAACMACLHLGEPSCRYYNGFLDRTSMFGESGYFRAASRHSLTAEASVVSA